MTQILKKKNHSQCKAEFRPKISKVYLKYILELKENPKKTPDNYAANAMSRPGVIFKIISIFKSTDSVIKKTANQFESENSHSHNCLCLTKVSYQFAWCKLISQVTVTKKHPGNYKPQMEYPDLNWKST